MPARPREYALPRGVHVNVHEGNRCGPGAVDGRSEPIRTTSCGCWGRRNCRKYLVNEIQEVYRLQGVNINDSTSRSSRGR